MNNIEKASADLILQILTGRQALANRTVAHESQYKDLLTTLLWKHTEAYGTTKVAPIGRQAHLKALENITAKSLQARQ